VKIALPNWKLVGWKRNAAYAAFFVVAFLVSLRLTFPVEAVKERLILDAAAQGYQVKVNDLSPSGLLGVRAKEMTILGSDGTRIPVEDLRVGLRLWSTLRGHRALDFDARLFDGRVTGFTDQSSTLQRFQARITGIDLRRAAPLRQATGLDLAGTLTGDLDVALDVKDPMKSTGTLEFHVKDAAILGGKLPVPGMEGGFSVPPVRLGAVDARGTVKNGRADFGTLEAKGDDVLVTADQVFVQLQPRLDYSALNGRARVRPTDAFWKTEKMALIRPLLEQGLASAKSRDGAYGFQIYGTVGKPQARPMAF
jgi:type II secretion system protein N